MSNYYRWALFFFNFLSPFLTFSQVDKRVTEKLSPGILKQVILEDSFSLKQFVVAVSDKEPFKKFLSTASRISTIYDYSNAGIVVIKSSWKDLHEKIIPRSEVIFVDQYRIPKEEIAVSNLDMSVNRVNLVQSLYPFYNGQSLVVSVKENRPDTADIDFKGRYVATSSVSPTLSSHATIMSTIIAGAGNSYYEGKGVATATTVTSTDFSNLLPEPDIHYQQYNISVQNHSYGTAIENYYGADAAAYDASVVTHPSLLHVFSAGNSGTLAGNTGVYTGIDSYANITGSFKMAKNILTVGHVDSFGRVLPASSSGPAYDGRIKPELVGFALDGSSGATAIVSGIALLLQDAYKQLKGSLPSAELVKAFLLNSADDVDTKGIDFKSGYGSVNANRAMQQLINESYFQAVVTDGMVSHHEISIPANTKSVKITLVWNDPPAVPNATKALMNDLDIELIHSETSQVWQPWVLNHFPDKDSLGLLPVRGRDTLNNVEQITIDNPVAGNYIIRVRGEHITASQTYSVVFGVEQKNNFSWSWPAKSDNVFAGTINTLRWESSFENSIGVLEYSIDNGAGWQQISDTTDLNTGYYQWMAPSGFTTALFRMRMEGQAYISDTVTISQRVNLLVGFNCPDSILLYWNRPLGIDSFQVYKLADRYLEPLASTRDTVIIVSKISNPGMHYAVAPYVKGKVGIKSFTINYTTQGVDCYLKSFLGEAVDDKIQLALILGSVYQVQRIILEKLSQNDFVALQIISVVDNKTSHSFTDASPSNGVNSYRIKIELNGGRIIYTEQVSVYYIDATGFYVFPNPVQRTEILTILSNQADEVKMQVYNVAGALVMEEIIPDMVNTISLARLSKGLYFLRFIKKDNSSKVIRLLIQ